MSHLVKGRWRLLKSAITKAPPPQTDPQLSVHGDHAVLNLISCESYASLDHLQEQYPQIAQIVNSSTMPSSHPLMYKVYNLARPPFDANETTLVFAIRSPRSSTIFDLASNIHSESKQSSSEKIDNTGNVGVWPSEEALARILFGATTVDVLHPLPFKSLNDDERLFRALKPFLHQRQTIVELGAGMTGLAGHALALGLRLAASHTNNSPSTLPSTVDASPSPKYVILTDGNAYAATLCTANLALNAKLIPSSSSPTSSVSSLSITSPFCTIASHQWIWGEPFPFPSIDFSSSSSSTPSPIFRYAQLIIAADCLFFEAWHDALLKSLNTISQPCSCTPISGSTTLADSDPHHVSSCGLFLSLCPSRGGSLQRFVERARLNDWHDVTSHILSLDSTTRQTKAACTLQQTPSVTNIDMSPTMVFPVSSEKQVGSMQRSYSLQYGVYLHDFLSQASQWRNRRLEGFIKAMNEGKSEGSRNEGRETKMDADDKMNVDKLVTMFDDKYSPILLLLSKCKQYHPEPRHDEDRTTRGNMT